MKKQKLAIFASGTGSNALNIIQKFKNHSFLEVEFVLSNKEEAGIVVSAKAEGINTLIFNNEQVSNAEFLIEVCLQNKIDFIILAGYLRKIPMELIHAFSGKIFNLHPSLLPKFGGKGMYGDNVHKAVLEAKEDVSGITIHLVNEEFDKGRILAQFSCPILPNSDLDSLRKSIHKLEQAYFPIVIEKTIELEMYVG